MFEIVENYMIQLFKLVPFLILLYIIFDLLGSLFFNKR